MITNIYIGEDALELPSGLNLPLVEVTADRALTLDDAGKWVYCQDPTDELTIPDSTFPAGTAFLIQATTADVTVLATGGVFGLNPVPAGCSALLLRFDDADNWVQIGLDVPPSSIPNLNVTVSLYAVAGSIGGDLVAGDDDGDGTTGFVAYSPDGTQYRIKVANGGALSTEEV